MSTILLDQGIDEQQIDNLVISIRAYAETRSAEGSAKPKQTTPSMALPSDWTVIFDTETTVDAGQSLRFGTYQVRSGDALDEAGLLYEPAALTADEIAVLSEFATAHSLALITRDEFVDRVFYGIGYDLRATIVGFNLPFDLSRLAIKHAPARGDMRGGFSLKLSSDKRKPPVQIKHLSQRTSLIRFAKPFRQRSAGSLRNRGDHQPTRRGYFVDLATFAAALFSRRYKLKSLGDFLAVEHPKLSTEEHGGTITPEYVEYAVHDTQTTWECYGELAHRYQALDLTDTPAHQIYSEASIGKAYLKAMNVRPWRELQPNVPPEILATIMNCYFGGRSEVRIRRELRQVILCDFLSMYPTVCTLMGLWRFVTAESMRWRYGTDQVRAFLEGANLAQLQNRETWSKLHALVQVQLDENIFPVRAHYGVESQATIGSNHLSSDEPLWFTLADCIASKLLTGRAPKVVRAIIFQPGETQSGLRQITIVGKEGQILDPTRDDFYRQLIELRHHIKKQRDTATGAERDALDIEQNAMKIAANATSYGIFVEVNVNEKAEVSAATVHSAVCDSFTVDTLKAEDPGRYFHPLLATLITGAARLMLAIAERLVADAGLEWTFCDTDSIAIAKPVKMSEREFQEQVDAVVSWFAALNPYDFGGSILKIEDVNFSLSDAKKREPLFCWAVSAKRYTLFNIDAEGRLTIRKASAHGLGHLRPPYDESNPAPGVPRPYVPAKEDRRSLQERIGVELWQHDMWWKIISAALSGDPDQVDFDYHPALREPAISRYAATTPKLLRWFKHYNQNRPYERQVKPFGFLTALFADALSPALDGAGTQRRTKRQGNRLPKPIAPYNKDPSRVAANAFDRETGEPIPTEALKSFAQQLAQYHLHPESKFVNGDFLDRGLTARRHVKVKRIRHIGKEANKWAEQAVLGFDPDEQIDYGFGGAGRTRLAELAREVAQQIGQRQLASQLGISRGTLTRVLQGKRVRQDEMIVRRLLSVLHRSRESVSGTP